MIHQDFYDKLLERRKIDEVTGCWNWTGPYHQYRPYPGNRYGYVSVNYKGRYGSRNVHRLMWIALHGDIPATTYICHKCDNPLCMNPEHLFAGTAKDNTHDMLAKNRHNNGKKTHCKRGHEFSGENVWVDKRGIRHCKVCGRERQLRKWHADPEFRLRQYELRKKKRRAARGADQL